MTSSQAECKWLCGKSNVSKPLHHLPVQTLSYLSHLENAKNIVNNEPGSLGASRSPSNPFPRRRPRLLPTDPGSICAGVHKFHLPIELRARRSSPIPLRQMTAWERIGWPLLLSQSLTRNQVVHWPNEKASRNRSRATNQWS